MNKLILLLPLLSFSTTTFSSSRLSFVDSCSKKEVKVATPNGMRLLVNISELNPEEGIELTVTFNPALSEERLKKQDKRTFTLRYGTKPNSSFRVNRTHVNTEGIFNGFINIPDTNWLKQVEQRQNGYRIWEANVRWQQLNSRKSGTLSTTFYHSPSTGPYFQVTSQALCQWEGDVEVASKLYENPHSPMVTISRDSYSTWEQSSSVGISLGPNNYEGTPNPLENASMNTAGFLGWLFDDWQNQLGEQRTYSMTRVYRLNQYESGVFIKRQSFNRYQARRFEWDRNAGHCGDFVAESEGFIDVGQMSESFVVVPPEYVGHPEQLKDFISKTYSSMTNCMDSAGFGSVYADDVLTSSSDEMIFYYRL